MNAAQEVLFETGDWWTELWRGMPSYETSDLRQVHSIQVDLESREDAEAFGRMLGHNVTPLTRSIWFPDADLEDIGGRRYVTAERVDPRYPVYIVSKGRWESRLTARALELSRIPYYVVVEAQERDEYARVVDPSRVLVLDPAYQRDYEACDDLGDSKSKGPGPARNFAWDHSISLGAARHWVLDDNIGSFLRLNRNRKFRADTGAVFRAAEDFVDRYENAPLSGFNYRFLGGDTRAAVPPLRLNRRIYSCLLIQNDLPFRWRGRYNEDTDISLRVLKAGMCTVLFQAFLIDKKATQTMKGGNTDEFYAREGTRPKSEMQVKLHPDVSRVVVRWGRVHHYVDYGPFRRNALRLKPGVSIPDGPNEYGMTLCAPNASS